MLHVYNIIGGVMFPHVCVCVCVCVGDPIFLTILGSPYKHAYKYTGQANRN